MDCLQVGSWLALEKSLLVLGDRGQEVQDCFGQDAADWEEQG